MAVPFRLPDEAVLLSLIQKFPGREHQIRTLASLLYPDAIPCRNVVLHGTEATGKSSITTSLLASLSSHLYTTTSPAASTGRICYAIVNAAQCITARHLYESIVKSVADALDSDYDGGNAHDGSGTATRTGGGRIRVETLAQLSVEMCQLLKYVDRGPGWRFVLVLDSVDRQREAPSTMIAGLARLSELIPCLTTVLIVTSPPTSFLHTTISPHIHFPPYSKPEFVKILSLTPPSPVRETTQQETSELWTRFSAAVHDSLIRSASRTLTSLRTTCRALWPRFTAPLAEGKYEAKEFSKLLVAARPLLQDESVLTPGLLAPQSATSIRSSNVTASDSASPSKTSAHRTMSTTTLSKPHTDLTALLPTAARLLLLTAYLASHNSPKHDLTLFSTAHARQRRRRRRGGATARSTPGARHRKVARKLLGAHAFVLERMMAIFEAVKGEWLDLDSRCGGGGAMGRWGLDGDLGTAIATLASLRLMVRVGGGGSSGLGAGGGGGADLLDRGGKWRVNVGWEMIRGLGRSMGVEVEEWLIE